MDVEEGSPVAVVVAVVAADTAGEAVAPGVVQCMELRSVGSWVLFKFCCIFITPDNSSIYPIIIVVSISSSM